jgi:hypothetical protein
MPRKVQNNPGERPTHGHPTPQPVWVAIEKRPPDDPGGET